jgi:RHS repeat-associated protein
MGTFPFGESWYNASNDKLLFTAYERDSESGNDYAQARYNISRLARFSSPDLLAGSTSDPQSLNRYSYVRNIPVMLTDPSGLCPKGLAQNGDTGDSQDTTVGGPFMTEDSGSDFAAPAPQSGCGPHVSPWGGSVWLDGADITDYNDDGFGIPIFGGAIIFGWERFGEYGGWNWVYAFPSPYPQGPGTGPSGGRGGGITKDQLQALKECLKELFGVDLKSFIPSTPGQNGQFTGTSGAGAQLTVTNDDTTYTTAGLDTIRYSTPTPPQGQSNTTGLTIDGYRATQYLYYYGIPIPNPLSFKRFSLNTNYTASDVGWSQLLGNQVHELGHSLAQILNPKLANTEDPFGGKLEDCVNQKALALRLKK